MQTLPHPPILPSPDAVPFWDACRRHELLLPYCQACSRHFFYPRTLCPTCGSRDVSWRKASGTGHLYTFCIQHFTSIPELRGSVPFVTAIVELDEGPRMMTFLTGVDPDPDAITCGMPVQVAFVDGDDGQTLPVFRPAV